MCFVNGAFAQETEPETNKNTGRFSGNLELNGNFFRRDSSINAINTPQYDRQLYGADAWLNLNYSNWGFDFGLRFDMFQNSYLLNPTGSYTDQGIGRWYVSKEIHKLRISGGYLYDIIGSGIIFRAYEERPLAIDQALYGIRVAYQLTDNWKIKAFTGRQKQQLEDPYRSVVRGLTMDGFVGNDSSKVTFAPGFGVVARTIADGDMTNLVAELNSYRKEDALEMFPDSAGPKYNTYTASVFNTLTAGPFTWYVEAAVKSKDVYYDPLRERITSIGDTIIGRYDYGRGTVFYSSLSYANKGFGITLEGKRTEHFDFRTRPQEQLNRGLLHYIPPMTRVNTYRVLSRYAAATQFVGELAYQADVRYAFSKSFSANLNFSNITDLKETELYREYYLELNYKYKRLWTLLAGAQRQEYNQDVYQFKPGAPTVKTITPFFDVLYKINKKSAVRVEGQYMNVEKVKGVRADYGNWLYGLVEFTIAPNWSFAASDMFNIDPGKLTPEKPGTKEKYKIHYVRLDCYYTFKANRFSISYVKQPEGIVCAGGICRLEPAFNGVKVTVNSTF
jgi:hypothetical protein